MAIDLPDIATLDTPDTAPDIAASPRSRRSLLAGALGALVGGVAGAFGRPQSAQAAAGSPLIIGQVNSAGTAATRLSATSSGGAFWMTQNGSGSGVRGDSTSGHGGVFTTNHADRHGLFAQQLGFDGAGAAVRAAGNGNHGVEASTDGAAKVALKATNSAVNGTVALFENTSAATGYSAGPAIRAYTGGGSDANVHPGGLYHDAAGEFAGPNGVIGAAAAAGGNGVIGLATDGYGVYGVATDGYGVFGYSADNSGVEAWSANDVGVRGHSTNHIGVYGSGPTYAGYFSGLLYATSVSAAIKAFRIDHPQDPAGKVLEHSCVESNERKLVYDGVVTTDVRGEATIELPGYFAALNRDLRYQLTPLADARAWVQREIAGNRFTLATSEPNTKVCWQVTGVRQDAYAKAHPLVVESAKKGREKGRYLNPIEHGKPESAGVGFELRQAGRGAASRD